MDEQSRDQYVRDWRQFFATSSRKIHIVEAQAQKIERVKEKYNIPEDSVLGSIVYQTGGILIDDWIRVLGSGERDILTWNEKLALPNAIIVADDVLGGLFAFMDKASSIHYFAPDSLEWEDLEISYTQFIQWLAEGNLDLFYELFRWDSWKEDVEHLQITEGISCFPFLWLEESTMNQRSKKIVSLEEIVRLELELSTKV
ncbi:DUF2625 family protein [Brevibacillus laterosporus]|uniref:DUF2625 family protein n=1 Tax=Brevibacillus laterosporus TaxID=1465 RepID=A0A0F7C1G9_BRELA|nr:MULTISPECIES: DUF2625 family protein [Brevibacillus]AKF95920.1 hypothetical protein EX87_20260 [Brevibacillus laterosporus]GIN99393.1 hypothetical protein J5TS2_00620 [Brevibacillus halotolerans]